MSTNEKSYKTGHPVLGIVLGILGIIAALLLCIFAGVIGGVIDFECSIIRVQCSS